MDFGWKKKTEKLRMVILSGGHQLARELPAELSRILDVFRRTHQTKDGSALQAEIARGVPQGPSASSEKMLWEPTEIHGWKIEATMYLREAQLWWLVYAFRENERSPTEKDIAFLDKVLGHLGAEPDRHAIIGPRSSPPGEPPLPFGWWTWRNGWLLYEIQVNKEKLRDEDKIRIVPRGTRETDGYTTLRPQDLAIDDDDEAPR